MDLEPSAGDFRNSSYGAGLPPVEYVFCWPRGRISPPEHALSVHDSDRIAAVWRLASDGNPKELDQVRAAESAAVLARCHAVPLNRSGSALERPRAQAPVAA